MRGWTDLVLRHRRRTAVLWLATVLVLAGCGDGSESAPEPAVHTAANGERFNDADVAFATDMIQHHAQALAMVDETVGRPLDPGVQDLVEAIRTAQGPEIETMVDWLTAWDQPVPATDRDHSHADSGGHVSTDPDMPGMMSAEQMDELAASADADFTELFLRMMIEHHQGAVEMARTEQQQGVHRGAVRLAGTIVTSQTAEIERMQRLLGS
jgi:uncharacterized protein (DUF305 family)